MGGVPGVGVGAVGTPRGLGGAEKGVALSRVEEGTRQ